MDQKTFFGVSLASSILFGLIMSANTCAEKPFTTIPWNGHVGAVSFTFDDALENQILNLKPILDKRPEAHVTFFLVSTSYYLTQQGGNKDFANLALAGHELGNHSKTHGHFTEFAKGDSELTEEIIHSADTLEALIAEGGANINITTFATPYCANNDAITDAIGKRHFINRDCGDWNYRNAWNKEPKWFSFPAYIWTRSGKTLEQMMVALDTCIGNADFSGLNSWETPPGPEGEWMVVLNHGVADDNDDYSVTPADMEKIIQHALDNMMWVESMGTVGAYYMAHFTMDSSSAIIDGETFKVRWEMPHPHMPPSIPLKVRINPEFLNEVGLSKTDSLVIEQDGNVIRPDADGNYTIEFAAQGLILRKASAEEKKEAESIPRVVLYKGNSGKYAVFDLNGNWICETDRNEIPSGLAKGAYIIRKK